jgi:hypothetical protein
MRSFAKEFLRDEPGGAERQIFLGAFGKHPGWDDHIDDIGLETESLVTAKQLLYVEGIGGAIGSWERLDWTAQVPFNHVFIWRREAQIIIGRMWASSDGKKRTRYPMVVCAHCTGTPLPLVLDTLLAWLEELHTRAMATTSADDVQAMIRQFRDALRDWLGSADEASINANFEAEAFFDEIGFAAADDTLVKALWRLRESHFATGKYKARRGLSPEQFRLPASPVSRARSLYFWERLLGSQFDPSVPVLLIAPLEQYWIDVIGGQPTPRELFCLRASPRAVSFTSDEAPPPDASFRDEAHALIESAAGGVATGPGRSSESTWMSRFFG